MSEERESWTEPLRGLLEAHGWLGNYLIVLPEYRPDLARRMAQATGMDFFDYRAQIMAARGWDAHSLTLDELDAALEERASARGIVALNVEALLATKERAARERWLAGFVARRWAHPVIATLCVFGDEVPASLSRCWTMTDEELPGQGFLNRLAM